MIGIKLADGSFYPVMEEGKPARKTIDLTTVQDNQTTVHVNLYRSETGTMEDAEYVDTLEIKNLNPHANGEPSLNLELGLDENNELSANISDPETGKTSETFVQIASKTLSELNKVPVDFQNDPTLAEGTGPADDSSNALIEDEDSVTISDDELEKIGLSSSGENDVIGRAPNDEEFSFDAVDNTLAQEDLVSDLPQKKDEENAEAEEVAFESAESVEGLDENIFDENITDENSFEEDKTLSGQEDISVPVTDDKDFVFEEESPSLTNDNTESEQNTEEEAADSFEGTDVNPEDEVFETDTTETTEDTNDLNALPDFDSGDEDFEEETDSESSNITDVALPDLEDDSDTFAMPDFNDEETGETETAVDPETPVEDTNEENTNDTEAYGIDGVFDEDFGEPDLSTENEEEVTPEVKDPTFQPSNSMFSDLYDKETLEGESSSYDEEYDEVKKKTKAPVIICIICAIICVIAALLVLFVIPSKINLLAKFKKPKTVVEKPVVEETEEEPEEETEAEEETVEIEEEAVEEEELPEPENELAAIEDEIVVADMPEAVVPEEPAKTDEVIEDIKYKIIWGDTLWDISNAYYKNPWRYKALAKYNNIKNPDHIIAGTWILIPAE